MPTLVSALRSEMRRLAAREVEKAARRLRRIQRQVKALRAASRAQRRALAVIERRIDRLKTRTGRDPAAGVPIPGGRGRGARLTPAAIRALRGRLGLSRLAFAKLLGVSPGSIFGWESGRTVPRGKNVTRVVALRRRTMGGRRSVEGARTRPRRRSR